MNNQNDTADQVLRLQNIAYVKQFMQKTSVKLLALVGFIQAIMVGYMLFSVRDVFVKIVEFAAALSPEFSAGSEDAITQFDLMTGALSSVINISSIILSF